MTHVDLLETLREAPVPASGTLERWRWLADVGARDLALAKLVEPHLDARSVLADLGAQPPGDDDPHPGRGTDGPDDRPFWS